MNRAPPLLVARDRAGRLRRWRRRWSLRGCGDPAAWNASPLTIRNSIIANDAENQYTPLNCTGSSHASPPAAGDHDALPTGTDCPAIDQRGEARGDPCTLGAVELGM